MANNSLQNKKSKGFIEFEKVEEMLSSIGLRSLSDYDREISRLEAEAWNQAGTGGLMVVSNINSLLSLISYSKSMLLRDEGNCKPLSDFLQIKFMIVHHLLSP